MKVSSELRVKLRSLLLTALIRAPSTASNSRPNRSSRSHSSESGAIVGAEIGDGLEVGFQRPQQPDDLDVAVAFGFQSAARPYAVEITVDVQLEQIAGRVARPAGRLRLDPPEPCLERSRPSTKASIKRTGLSGPT